MTDFTITLQGQSGVGYRFNAYPLGGRFRPVPGVYVFLAPAPGDRWRPVYIGETHDLDERVGGGLRNHHKLQAALDKGATRLGVRTAPAGRPDRLELEADLCARWKPDCNGPASPINSLAEALRRISGPCRS